MIATLLSLVLVAAPQEPLVSKPDVLRAGHVVEIRGSLDESGRFVAQKLELLPQDSDDVLIGTVPEDQSDPLAFTLLTQEVVTDAETSWGDLSRGSLAGKRVKVEGGWKGPTRFRADSIYARGSGRDRIASRLDELYKVEGGWEARVMKFPVFIPDDADVEHEKPVGEYGIAPERRLGVSSSDRAQIERDEDDSFGQGYPLTDTLRIQGQFEFKASVESNYDLARDPLPGSTSNNEEDRTDYEFPARLRLLWTPSDKLVGMWELKYTEQYRRDEDGGGNDSETNHSGGFGETWLQWRDIYSPGFDVTVGRQDFDDEREWIFDENLDALRASWIRPAWRLDVAAATLVTGGSERDEASTNEIVYLSNGDYDRHLAVWGVYRDIDDYNGSDGLVPEEQSLHLGVRAIGEWFPQNEIWAELAYQSAERPLFDASGTSTGQDADVSAWAYDIGTTWSPPFADPLYFTVGYALASGNGDDGTFRQTGFQDNTHRFGGVTSFQYYGEVFDPELSNLGILTLGVGARLVARTSLDFVFHTYTQDEASAEFSPQPNREADLKRQPNGLDGDLGWEADLILGYRQFKSWDLEIVGATFDPGDGFDGQDNAYLMKFQLRYRF